jgi:hypothetical protein
MSRSGVLDIFEHDSLRNYAAHCVWTIFPEGLM